MKKEEEWREAYVHIATTTTTTTTITGYLPV